MQGTRLKKSMVFHPQTDGQSKIVNKCLENYLRCFCSEHPRTWGKWVVWAEYWYNTIFHMSINTTLFQVLYDRTPPPLIFYAKKKRTNDVVEIHLTDMDTTIEALKGQLPLAQ